MKIYSLIIVLIFAAAVQAGAQTASKTDNPCASEGKQYCSDASDFKEFVNCLKSNSKHLSSACRGRVGFAIAIGKKFKEKKSACKADSEKFCKDAGKQTLKCLLHKKDQVSKGCQKDLTDWRRAMSIAPQRIKDDVKKKMRTPAPAKKK
jgi:hypothetical protein